MHSMEHVVHGIAPIVTAHSRILILGTMPSPKSREAGFYYAHKQNRFWRALALALMVDEPRSVADKIEMIERNDLALWDVLHACNIVGASDASIRNPIANDIPALIAHAPIVRVLCTGSAAARLYRRLVEPTTGLACAVLPSPSAANARYTLTDLANAYRAALR